MCRGVPWWKGGHGEGQWHTEREIAGFNHMNGANCTEMLPNSTTYPLANPAFVWSLTLVFCGAGEELESVQCPPAPCTSPRAGMPQATLQAPSIPCMAFHGGADPAGSGVEEPTAKADLAPSRRHTTVPAAPVQRGLSPGEVTVACTVGTPPVPRQHPMQTLLWALAP